MHNCNCHTADEGYGSPNPGKFEIIDSAIKLCRFAPGAKIVDVGSGRGTTVAYLRKKYKLDAIGVEPSKQERAKGKRSYKNIHLLEGIAEQLPLKDKYAEAIVCECSFSLVEKPIKALLEFYRVLKPAGFLIIADMYSRTSYAKFSGTLSNIYTKENFYAYLQSSGFRVLLFQDYTGHLKSMAAEKITKLGIDGFFKTLGTDIQALRRIKMGYGLIVAQKEDMRTRQTP